MAKFIIQQSLNLQGEVEISGSKNEMFPIIATACLTDEDVIVKNLPKISDTQIMLEIFEKAGGKYEFIDESTVRLNGKNLCNTHLDSTLFRKLRGSIVMAGAILTRLGEVFIPRPGGDKIGTRQIDTHLNAFKALGADVFIEEEGVLIKAKDKKLQATSFMLDEQGVTPTENAILASALIDEGATEINYAACEPHVENLCKLLIKMGVDIMGVGSNKLKIRGKPKLDGATHIIGHEILEAGSFIALAGATDSELTLNNIECDKYNMIQMKYDILGIDFELRPEKNQIFIPKKQRMKIKTYSDGKINVIKGQTWPGFPPDLMSVTIVAATQCEGSIFFHDWMYDGRMYFVDKLKNMGAQIVTCDPHRIVTIGKTSLYGEKLESPDIRAGVALVIAGLCAEGQTEISHIEHIDRGYENFEKKLQKLGASIERVN
jgi:UDP-N-acetylglucosamine 1-carboxyvinyltransferase